MNRSMPTSRDRRWLAGLSVLALVGAVGLIPAASVAAAEPANPVLDWNINAVNAIGNPVAPPVTTPPTPPGLGQPPPIAVIHLAMVHGCNLRRGQCHRRRARAISERPALGAWRLEGRRRCRGRP